MQPSHADEEIDEKTSPAEHVLVLAKRKAESIAEQETRSLILAADTIVVLGDVILNKPASEDEAYAMLSTLSGKMHEVYTGYAIWDPATGTATANYVRTEVWFRELGADEIRRYIATGSPMDKAGSYGIQDDYGAVFVERINGDFYNVVGLPLCALYGSLKPYFLNGSAAK